MMSITKVTDLNVYNVSLELAMNIFHVSVQFPQEEKYSLTDQIRRSSRSVSINIAEGWGKRRYTSVFKRHLIDSLGSLEETKGWLDFSKECNYIEEKDHKELFGKYDSLGAMILNCMIIGKDWESEVARRRPEGISHRSI